jgi:hypothetical protein
LVAIERSAYRAAEVGRQPARRLAALAGIALEIPMIRALALLCLTMAACYHASPHAAPAMTPQVCEVAAEPMAPQDPYTSIDMAAFAAHATWCAPGQTCSFDCDHGGCAFACAAGSTCNVQCDGGDCQLSCAEGSTCNFQCDGGRCGTGCGAGATCNLECDGGSCAHACAPDASCSSACDGGNCS